MSTAPGGRLLIPSSALLWGLQFALLSPALALILATLYGASLAEIGWSLAIYQGGGFLAALVIPAWADRGRRYLPVMLASAVLTVLLAALLAAVTTLPLATAVLVVVGGPAGLGSTMLFAHLRDIGASTSRIVNVRAIVSVAWMAGPPLATAIIGAAGGRGILLALAVIGVLNVLTTLALLRTRHVAGTVSTPEPADADDETSASGIRASTVLVLAAFVLFQATNATAMTFMAIYVTDTVGLAVIWAGITLGVAAALEVPALILIGRLGDRMRHLTLVAAGAVAGAAYYLGLAVVTEPVLLLALQLVNAVSFATVSGIGLALFQDLIRGAGLSTGLFMNTRRLGAVLSGPIIALGAVPVLGPRGIFLVCAALTLIGLAMVLLAAQRSAAEERAKKTQRLA